MNAIIPRNSVILIVEDEPQLQILLALRLTAAGFEIRLASNGQTAIELFREYHNTIDLVLMDLHLPYLDGPEVFEVMKEFNPNLLCCCAPCKGAGFQWVRIPPGGLVILAGSSSSDLVGNLQVEASSVKGLF